MTAAQTTLGTLRATALLMLSPFLAQLAFAAPPSKKAYFDETTTPNAIALLPMPPDVGSREEAADRESSLAIYTARTPDEVALGKSQNKLTAFHFSRVLGSWLDKSKLPKTDALFAKIDREVIPLINNAKKYYQRPHPAQVDAEHFKEVIDKVDTGAYPSGHATRATLYGILLAELIPNQRAASMALSREMGWLRVVGGVETPLDVYAGRVLGRAFAQSLLQNPEFLADLDDVREEITAAISE